MLGRTEELIAKIATGAGFSQALVEHLANALGADAPWWPKWFPTRSGADSGNKKWFQVI